MVKNIDEAKQLAYAYDRKEHTARILVETNPQIVINEAEKGLTEEEAVSEGIVKAEPNISGETPILEREWVSQFNGS